MGLLDDAIREHLDLKRRRGADPAEIERAEREALGPVRRNRGESATAEAEPELAELIEADEAQSAGEAGYDEPPLGAGYDELTEPADDDFDEPEADHQPEPAADSAPPRLSFSREEEEFADPDEPPFDDEAHETRVMRVPEEHAAPPSPPEPAMSDATAEYDVEDALAAEQGEGDDEDPLEETPEFLQDTPDHDRLWFEQRPPRDFDFDG